MAVHPLRAEVDATLAADPRVAGWALVDEPFAVWNAQGERRTPLPPTDAGRRVFRLRMVEVVAKRVARGDEDGAREILTHLGAAPGGDPPAEALVDGDDTLATAVRRLLGVVRVHAVPGTA